MIYPLKPVSSLLDWLTLTYSPSLRMASPKYRAAWNARHARALSLPIVGRFFRAWDAAGDPHAEAAAEFARHMREFDEEMRARARAHQETSE